MLRRVLLGLQNLFDLYSKTFQAILVPRFGHAIFLEFYLSIIERKLKESANRASIPFENIKQVSNLNKPILQNIIFQVL